MERTYVIPLRREWLKTPIYKRTKKAVSATKSFLQKHMKVKNVKLGRQLNMKLWAQGYRHPPHKVEVSAELVKDKEGDYVYAELIGVKKEPLKKIKEEKKTGLAGKIEQLTGKEKAAEHKAEEIKEEEKAIKELTDNKQESRGKVSAEKSLKKEDAIKDRTKNIFSEDKRKER